MSVFDRINRTPAGSFALGAAFGAGCGLLSWLLLALVDSAK